jgi:hypothetical protein
MTNHDPYFSPDLKAKRIMPPWAGSSPSIGGFAAMPPRTDVEIQDPQPSYPAIALDKLPSSSLVLWSSR